MKITIGMKADQPATPDYDMLKAALVAAQAATPTGRASSACTAKSETHEALHALFCTGDDVSAPADALDHQFSRTPTEDGHDHDAG